MKAILIGATGLVGKEIARELVADSRFSHVHLLTRRPSGLSHPKIQESIVDFEKPLSWKAEVVGDVLFSAMGTTSTQAGSQAAQYRVDHDYPLEVAQAAKDNGVQRCVFVSSAGANSHSRLFYLRMKGELEDSVTKLGFDATFFLRPGPLDGNREHPRMGERIMLSFLNLLPKISGWEQLQPIDAKDVARLCVACVFDERKPVTILEPKELFSLLKCPIQ